MVGISTRKPLGTERSYTLTMPIDLYEDMAALGAAEGRSMHREMLWLLQEGRAKRQALIEPGREILESRREEAEARKAAA